MILTIKTDNPEAEVGVFGTNGEQKAYQTWQAHRELEATILTKIEEVLSEAKITNEELSGLVVYAGPGSFTGLRIGFSVANTLAHGLSIPNQSASGENWIQDGIKLLKDQNEPQILVPNYGGDANITTPRK